MTVFKLPDLGEGLSEAEILRWHVKVGDHIQVDAPMLSVETAKAVVDVPAPLSGTITALHAQPGDRIEIGAALVEFAADSPAGAGEADSGTVVGHMPAQADEAAGAASSGAASPAGPAASAARIRAVPAARVLARSLGVDLAGVTGTGRAGLVTLEDVLAVGLPARPAAQANAAGENGDVQALHSLRRAMAQSMTVARDSVMQCSVFDNADLNGWRGGEDYTSRVLRAIVAGVRAEPGLNAWYDERLQSRTLFKRIDVGIAVDTTGGLLVPVIRQVSALSAAQRRAELDRLKRAARDRTLGSEELRNCTFMLSNFGMLAGRYATPVVVPPAVAILGTGRVRHEPVALAGRVEVHPRMPLSLSFDHRVVTGGEAVRFFGAVIADLELPE